MNEPRIIELPKIIDPRGNLSFFENSNQIPFDIKRTYWIYEVLDLKIQENHAFKKQQEFTLALFGSFDVVLNDKLNYFKFSLKRSYYRLHIPKMFWRKMESFQTNSLALIVSNEHLIKIITLEISINLKN